MTDPKFIKFFPFNTNTEKLVDLPEILNVDDISFISKRYKGKHWAVRLKSDSGYRIDVDDPTAKKILKHLNIHDLTSEEGSNPIR